jgi:hypothetical protein
MIEVADSDRIFRGYAVDPFDVIAGDFATGSLHDATDKEENVERARLRVQNSALDCLACESEPTRALIEPIDETHVACFRIADLVKRQWFVLKTLLIGQRTGQKVLCGSDDVPSFIGADVHIDLGDLSITLNVDRVSVERWLNEVPGIAERRLVGAAEIRIRFGVPPEVGECIQQAAPVAHEWRKTVERNRNQRTHVADGVAASRDELCNDAPLSDTLDVKSRSFVSRVAAIFLRNCSKRGGQIQKVERLLVPDLNQKSRVRLAHAPGPQRFVADDSQLGGQFNFGRTHCVRGGR